VTLGQKQELFARLEAEWVLWVLTHPGWALRRGEGRILQLGADGKRGRRARLVIGQTKDGRPTYGGIVRVRDLVHMDGGNHYAGLACDWQLFVDGQHVTTGEHPAWVACGENWESRHALCRWGGRFADGNHISLEHDGKK